jgi:hypothetical protein
MRNHGCMERSRQHGCYRAGHVFAYNRDNTSAKINVVLQVPATKRGQFLLVIGLMGVENRFKDLIRLRLPCYLALCLCRNDKIFNNKKSSLM